MASCNQSANTLFVEINARESGISFSNDLIETDSWGYVSYYYFYNGGGVAAGDVNNDGLPDIYLTGNMVPNKLFLNRGSMRFEDVSETAGVAGDDRWMTGVSMADVNNDGWLDIYVCSSGLKENTKNLLFINSGKVDAAGIPRFEEQGASYNLDDEGHGTQATFFDYDNDGDLDCYVMNHHVKFDWRGYEAMIKDPESRALATDNLYRNPLNEDPLQMKFVDVSDEAGIDSYGYGLGVIAQDFNKDGYVDIYVSNDFVSPDYFYMNNGDGTFTDQLQKVMGHTATQSMGLDAGDINNDGWSDLFVLDMLPEDNYRRKMTTMDRGHELFAKNVADGNFYQYMTNVLQLNEGINLQTRKISFSDIGGYAGVTMTDWSWGPLIADFDGDSNKDLFVTTGILRDVNYNDFWKHIRKVDGEWQVMQRDIEKLPSVPLSNYLYSNQGDFTFSNATKKVGLAKKGFSNGSAYGDFDNDGDLDLIINNLESNAQFYENKTSDDTSMHFISFAFRGREDNSFGMGVKVDIKSNSGTQFGELTMTRGYQSSVPPELYFGLGEDTLLQEVVVHWPNGTSQQLSSVPADQKLMLYQSDASHQEKGIMDNDLVFEVIGNLGISFRHQENDFNDFTHQHLLPYMLSRQGPALASADINNDGLDDIFIGAAKGFESLIFVQKADGTFENLKEAFKLDKKHEDTEALFFHANDDNYIDLYVCSGGYERALEDDFFQDRLYLNQDGKQFRRIELPKINNSTSTVAAGDMDHDGDIDLFIGGRLVPNNYPYVPRSYILENDGKGSYKNVSNTLNKELTNPGMVTDALWTDFDNDSVQDLIIVGEWMPIRIFKNTGKDFIELSNEFAGLSHTSGLWNCVEQADLDQDGDLDYIVGNIGLNFKYKASIDKPLSIFASDFDNSGSLDIILGFSQGGKVWPVRDKRSLEQQLPSLEKEYPDYESFARATVYDIIDNFSGKFYHREVVQLATVILENRGDEVFQMHQLPAYAQFSSVMDIIATDYNSDGNIDLILAGNQYDMESNTTRLDAGKGLVLEGNGDLSFEIVPPRKSGFFAIGNVRKLAWVNGPDDARYLIVANNNDQAGVYHFVTRDSLDF